MHKQTKTKQKTNKQNSKTIAQSKMCPCHLTTKKNNKQITNKFILNTTLLFKKTIQIDNTQKKTHLIKICTQSIIFYPFAFNYNLKFKSVAIHVCVTFDISVRIFLNKKIFGWGKTKKEQRKKIRLTILNTKQDKMKKTHQKK